MSESKSGSWWATMPGILTGVAAVITAVTGMIVALNSAGVFDGDDDPTPPAVTTADPEPDTRNASITTTPATSPSDGTVTLTYTPEGDGCGLSLEVDIGGTRFFPQGLRHVQPGVPLGTQSYEIAGEIQCLTLGFCTVVGSGSILVDDRSTFAVIWNPIDFDVCEVGLL